MQFINFHTHFSAINFDTISIFNQDINFFLETSSFYSIGIHPWTINSQTIKHDLEIITNKLTNKNCIAIGECGLDKKIAVDMSLQIDVFIRQLMLAQRHQKPVIVHCVSAYNELVAIKKKHQFSMPIIVHGFSKNEIVAQMLVKEGFYLSIGSHLIQNKDFEKVFNSIPIEKLFLETDNAKIDIKTLYEKAANVLELTQDQLVTAIFRNFTKLFKNIILC